MKRAVTRARGRQIKHVYLNVGPVTETFQLLPNASLSHHKSDLARVKQFSLLAKSIIAHKYATKNPAPSDTFERPLHPIPMVGASSETSPMSNDEDMDPIITIFEGDDLQLDELGFGFDEYAEFEANT
jgi:hypothetical protein